MNKAIASNIYEQNIEAINGSTQELLVNKADEAVVDLAARILTQVKNRAIYNEFSARVDSDKIAFYFLARLKEEIKPYVFKALKNESVYIPERHIFTLLRELLELYGIRVNNDSNFSKSIKLGSLSAREFSKRIRLRIANIWNSMWRYRMFEGLSETRPLIAVYISEGIDIEKRSDIQWLPQSRIEPDRLLLFINESSLEKKYKLFARPNKRLIEKLRASPFKWVFIPQKRLTCMHEGVWAPEKIKLPEWANMLAEKVSDGIDKWIFNICRELLYEIDFWKSFLEKFHVKMLYYSGEGSTTFIAQGIAFDILGEKSGFAIGKQRSDLGQPAKVLTGYHTKDIVFTWNNRNPEYFSLPYNIVHSQIVAGHPNGANFLQENAKIENVRQQFIEKKVQFIITLFDTGHGRDGFSRNFLSSEMEMIYSEFLSWILEDNTVGLLIKSKKPYILKNLPNILPLFKTAEQTGRCVLLPFECLPSQASRLADMVVGLAVSSALSEAVIAGCKGIHYHSRFPENHEYYRWGYEKLVFDDLNRMMNALKSYKADRSSNPELGDWTPYLDSLDPFRDGRAGERMGTYIRWCLEGFDAGLSRNDVIKEANSKYVKRWGNDKVIKFADI